MSSGLRFLCPGAGTDPDVGVGKSTRERTPMVFATTDRALRAVGDGPGARKPDRSGLAAVRDGMPAARRRMSIVFDRRGSRLVREVVEDDPSIAGRLAWLAGRRPLPHALWI